MPRRLQRHQVSWGSAGDAIGSDMGEGMHWHAFGGLRMPTPLGQAAALMSRLFLEQLVRERTLRIGGRAPQRLDQPLDLDRWGRGNSAPGASVPDPGWSCPSD